MPTEELTYRQNVVATLERIEAQTIKTNGRVNKLELWQSCVLGFCAAITLLILPVVVILFPNYL